MGNKRFGFHSGECSAAQFTQTDSTLTNTFQGGITVKGSFTFGDAVADSWIVNGRISTSTVAGAALSLGATYTYGQLMEMRVAVDSWTGIAGSFQGYYFRAQANVGNASYGLRGMEVYGVCNITTGTTGLNNLQALYSEMLIKANTSGNKTITNASSIEANISIENWGATTLTFTNNIYCLYAKAQTGTGLADYTKVNGIKIAGRDDGTARVFGNALDIADPEATVCTWTNGINITTSATTAINVATGTYTTGLSLAGTLTTGIAVGAATTGISLTGTKTTGISMTGTVATGISALSVDAGTISGEVHGFDLANTGTLSSGDSIVGLNMVTTTAGTAGTWASAGYFKVVQGSTKNVNGYLTACEFEAVNTAANVSDWFVVTLNANNSGANRGQHESYIALRDYGSTTIQNFVWFGDDTIATSDAAALLSTAAAARTHTHSIRFMIGNTAYYVMCTSTGG